MRIFSEAPISHQSLSIESLIPHRPPILLVERVVEIRDDSIVCEGRVPSSSPLAGESTTPALAIELAAQSAAVLGALERIEAAEIADGAGRSDESPRIGYLAAIRSARFHASAIPADEPLRARVRRTGAMAGLTIYEAEVETVEGQTLLTASFSTMLVG